MRRSGRVAEPGAERTHQRGGVQILRGGQGPGDASVGPDQLRVDVHPAGVDIPKLAPHEVVAQALDGLEAGKIEVIADKPTANVKASLSRDPADFYADITGNLFA